MDSEDTGAEPLVYTAKDIETYLSHLAHWYKTVRSGDKDVLRRPAETEDSLLRLSVARKSMRLNPEKGPEFTRSEVLAMLERLSRRKARSRRREPIIRPLRLVAAMRGIRTRQAGQTENPST